MENASKALLIAAAVLIVIILIALGVKLLSPTGDTAKQSEVVSKQMEDTTQKATTQVKTSLGKVTGSTSGGKAGGTTGSTTPSSGDKSDEVPPMEPSITGKIFGETQRYTDNKGDSAYIPEGFGIVAGCTTIDEGLVISDKFDEDGKSEGNEFVWVPVEIKATDSTTSIAAMERTKWKNNNPTAGLSTNYKEPCTSGYSTEVQEYYDMLESVYNYEGFYIGRYEAGSETPRYDKANGTTEMSVKRGKYPYNYVGWGPKMSNYEGTVTWDGKDQGYGAVYLSKELYKEKDVGVVSTLIYGSQWDATMRFIKDIVNVIDGTKWGNHCNTTFTFNGEYSTNKGSTWNNDNEIKPTFSPGSGYLLTTGASEDNKAKNIYDLTGNVWEWTMESNNNTYRIVRGGDYDNNSKSTAASYRYDTDKPAYTYYNTGFRPALYLK